jgi:hypothetical protein
MPWPVSTCGEASVTRPSIPDFRKEPKNLPRAGRLERAALTLRPGEKGNHQPDTRSAADQEGAAIDCGKLHPRIAA